MKTLLKTIIACLVIFQATTVFAQQFNTSQMNTSGQSSSDTKARYILGLVRNNNVKALDSYFSTQPWDIQANIDVYKDAKQTASVSIFCVAVDLGYVDIVKTFVKYGYGPADLCEVKTYKTGLVLVSKADAFYHYDEHLDEYSHDRSDSWMGKHSGSESGHTLDHTINETYNSVSYQNKTIVKHYFARPLDFASGEMFDYLFEQGFRSEQLLQSKALAEAKRLGRTEVVDWILENAQKGGFAPLLDDDTFAILVQYARQNKDSLAYQALANGTLKVYKTSTEAKNASKELENKLKDMEKNLQIKSPSDTVGYSTMQQQIKAKATELAQKEKIQRIVQPVFKKIEQQNWPSEAKTFFKNYYKPLVANLCKKDPNVTDICCSYSSKTYNKSYEGDCSPSDKRKYGNYLIWATINCK